MSSFSCVKNGNGKRVIRERNGGENTSKPCTLRRANNRINFADGSTFSKLKTERVHWRDEK